MVSVVMVYKIILNCLQLHILFSFHKRLLGFIILVVLTGAENLWAYPSRSGHSTSFCLEIKSSFKHSLLQVLYRPETYPVEVPNPIERFIHSVYEGDCWELFKKKKLSNEGLPPTRTILILHCCRLNYCC